MNELIGGIILIGVYLTSMLIIVQLKKDNSIGNFTWGGGVLLITLYTFCWEAHTPRSWLIMTFIFLWATRLIMYVYMRYKKGADPHFIAWQKQWGNYALLISFWWIFIMNGILLIIMAVPSILINMNPVATSLNLLDLVGFLIWVIGFYCESIADYQLYIFMHKPENKEKIMQKGLWYYSRHPNYFGEITMWWGIFCIALSVEYGYLALITPVTITILLRYFTGVPLLEGVFEHNPQYQEYKTHTSTLIPWFKK